MNERPSMDRVPTPSLLLDLDILDSNIAIMAERCRARGVSLRPHAKTHKCSAIAKRQIAAGAVGISAATMDEAEVMGGAGCSGILITAPIVTSDKIDRLLALLGTSPTLGVVADDPANIRALAEAAGAAGLPLTVLVDLDVGHHRTGVQSVGDAVALARLVASMPSLWFGGLQAYAGHVQHIRDPKERFAQAMAVGSYVAEAKTAIEAAGLAVPVVTGAGTGTHEVDGGGGVFTELQAGSYVFMDEDYGAVAAADEAAWPFGVSLLVRTTVISSAYPGHVTTDAGTKAFALNGPPPRIVTPALAGSAYSFAGDEHGRIAVAPGHSRPAVGDRIDCVVSHCDPTVALYDRYYCVRHGKVVDIWPIDARGRA